MKSAKERARVIAESLGPRNAAIRLGERVSEIKGQAAKIEALEGVLRMLQKEAERRAAATAGECASSGWEWVASVAGSALGDKA